MKRLVGIAISTLLLATASHAAAAPTDQPSATVSASSASLGDKVLVHGTAWPPRSLVHLVFCGNLAIDGSADCDLQGGIDAGVGQDGSFSMLVVTNRPPVPCPCVVWVTDAGSIREARVPVSVAGLPIDQARGRVATPDISALLKVSTRLSGHGSWAAWFGSGSRRTLSISIRNTSSTAIRDPGFSLTFGKGNDPTGFVLAPALGMLAPGAVQVYEAMVPIDTFSLGGYTVKGEIVEFGNPIVFRDKLSVHPWGLLVAALVLVQLLLLLARNRVRRRVLHGEQPQPAQTAPAALSTPVNAPVTPAAPTAEVFAAESVVDLRPTIELADGEAGALATRARLLAAEAARLAGAAMAAVEVAAYAAQLASEAAEDAAQAALTHREDASSITPVEVTDGEWLASPRALDEVSDERAVAPGSASTPADRA